MDASQMSLGKFLETALQTRAKRDKNRNDFLEKGDTKRADKCHYRARDQLRKILNRLDPQKVVYLYPYIELKVQALHRDWFEDIKELCKVQPNWKRLTWDGIRTTVLDHQSEIRKQQITRAEQSKADDELLEQFGPPAPDEPPDEISESCLLVSVDETTEPQLAPDPAPDPVQL